MSLSKKAYAEDGFTLGWIEAIQPALALADLEEECVTTSDPRIFRYMTNLLQVWSQSRHDLPRDFASKIQVTAVSRVPLTVVAVETQQVGRSIQQVMEAYHGEQIDSSAWKTHDPFLLTPVELLAFPVIPSEATENLPGGEQVQPCVTCGSEGRTTCDICAGSAEVLCEDCGGTRQIICSRCDGGGTHLGASGNYIQCQLCNTRGYVRCQTCLEGKIACRACTGGYILCKPCDGQGKQKLRWTLLTEMRTHARRQQLLPELWPVKLEEKTNELHLIYEEAWPWPRDLYPQTPLDSRFTPRLRAAIQTTLEQSLNAHAASLANIDRRATGAKVMIFGGYAYEVDYSYEEDRERVYITGLKNRVFTARGKTQPPGFFKKLAGFWHKAVDVLVGQEPQVDQQMQKAAGKGQVHIADTKFLVPQAAAQLNAECQLTTNGYLITLALRAPQQTRISVPLEFDVDTHGGTIMCVKQQLGLADREQFPEAMRQNRELFGRLAVSEVDSQGKRFFEYHDRRLYSEMSADHCAAIIRAVATDLAGLQAQRQFN